MDSKYDDQSQPLISVVTPCYNEEENVDELCARIEKVFENLPQYRYEHILIDNHSADRTVERVKALAANDRRIKLIVNMRNFGHIRSPMHAMLQANGDAVISLASDLQDPPELIPEFLAHWERGYLVVAGVKPKSQDSFFMKRIRSAYYRFLGQISEVPLVKDFTGFGLYDRRVMDEVRKLEDPYPYFRGLISELGFPVAEVAFVKPARARGITNNNFFTLYDMAMLGITTHSRLPIRLATMAGFLLAGVSLAVSLMYFFLKVIFWDKFVLGEAPILIGIFFFASVQLFFIGLMGEYIGAIHTQILKRPLVVESERVNFAVDRQSRSSRVAGDRRKELSETTDG
jgi:glycosyltransferase involved in cell wall biosynthesis